jgi:hypothetical protein
MSVLVIMTVQADKAAFEKLIAERGDVFEAISGRAKAAGAIHHRFGIGSDGTVVSVDEWDRAESFQKFFDDPGIAATMQDAGVTAPPQVTIVEALTTPDQF